MHHHRHHGSPLLNIGFALFLRRLLWAERDRGYSPARAVRQVRQAKKDYAAHQQWLRRIAARQVREQRRD